MPQDLNADDLIDLGVIPGQNDVLARQMAYANALRSSPLAQGHSTNGVYTAPSPIGMLGSVAKQVAGQHMADQLNQQQMDNLHKQIGGRKQYFDLIRQLAATQGQGSQAGQFVGGTGGTTNFDETP